MPDSIDRFVAALAREETGALVNQYSVEIPGLDRPGGAAIRRANLRAYLEPRKGARLALIGEAPSAHGARFSGIAFTAERSLPPSQWTSAPALKPNGFAEHSATIVRRALVAVEIDPAQVLLWNAVPFHPRHPDDPLKNREPDADELVRGDRWLQRFIDLMQPRRVAAVGRWAQSLRPDWTPLRHPSHGGGPELQTGLARLLAGDSGGGQQVR
jgi:hypothetical protein